MKFLWRQRATRRGKVKGERRRGERREAKRKIKLRLKTQLYLCLSPFTFPLLPFTFPLSVFSFQFSPFPFPLSPPSTCPLSPLEPDWNLIGISLELRRIFSVTLPKEHRRKSEALSSPCGGELRRIPLPLRYLCATSHLYLTCL